MTLQQSLTHGNMEMSEGQPAHGEQLRATKLRYCNVIEEDVAKSFGRKGYCAQEIHRHKKVANREPRKCGKEQV